MSPAKFVVLVAVPHGAVDDHDRVINDLAAIGCQHSITADGGQRFALHGMTFVFETQLEVDAVYDLVIGIVRKATLHLAPPEVAVFRFDRATWKLRELPQGDEKKQSHLNG